MLLCLLSMSLLSAAPAEVDSAPPAATVQAEPTWSASVSLGTSANFSSPSAQITFERRLAARWTMELGGSGSYYEGLAFRTESVQLVTGARFYLTSAFRGLWVGSRVQLGWQGFQSRSGFSTGLGGLGGLGGGVSSGVQGAAAALLGYTFRWDNGAMLSISAGPQVTHVFPNAQISSSTSVGLQTFASLGIAF